MKGENPPARLTFALTFWVEDAYAGTDNVRSDVMLALWKAFKDNNIRVPYPVREIRVRGGALPVDTPLEIPMDGDGSAVQAKS